MTTQKDKNKEVRLRRALKKQGYLLQKSRVVNSNLENQGLYRIIDAQNNVVIAGSNFDLSLNSVEGFVERLEYNLK